MKTPASSIERLLQAAATVPKEPAPAMPFGFDTRVVALWRASWSPDPAIAHLLRRVMFIAVTLIVLASAGAYREFSQGDEGDEYALTDSAIGGAFDQ